MATRVALFFDGKNFYRALDSFNATLRIDYDRLTSWIVEQVAGRDGKYVGSYYYTGYRATHEKGPGQRLAGFLKSLSFQLDFLLNVSHSCRGAPSVENVGISAGSMPKSGLMFALLLR